MIIPPFLGSGIRKYYIGDHEGEQGARWLALPVKGKSHIVAVATIALAVVEAATTVGAGAIATAISDVSNAVIFCAVVVLEATSATPHLVPAREILVAAAFRTVLVLEATSAIPHFVLAREILVAAATLAFGIALARAAVRALHVLLVVAHVVPAAAARLAPAVPGAAVAHVLRRTTGSKVLPALFLVLQEAGVGGLARGGGARGRIFVSGTSREKQRACIARAGLLTLARNGPPPPLSSPSLAAARAPASAQTASLINCMACR